MPQIDLLGGNTIFSVLIRVIPFVIVAVVLLVIAMRGNAQASASKNWESTTGQILMSQIEMRRRSGRAGMSPFPVVVYEYMVMGQRFQSNRISFGNDIGGSMVASPTVNRYPVGSTVTVYYNPANPAEAVLERKSRSSNVLIFVVIVIFAILACTTIATVGGMSLISNMINDLTSQLPTR
jgi:hypothetical protein